MSDAPAALIRRHLHVLAEEIGPRPPGSPANRRATDHLRAVLEPTGLRIVEYPFRARYWEPGGGELTIDGVRHVVESGPFSSPCAVRGRIVRADSLERVEPSLIPAGSLVVLDGDLAAAPYFPLRFPFLTLRGQQDILHALIACRPGAVLAVAPEGSPEPVFEDGDLPFPYATVGGGLGASILDGSVGELTLRGTTREGDGLNVSAIRDGPGPRVLLSAHVDSKVTTPGALDNGGGVATLLALAETGLPEVPAELVFFNGEDHYAAPGEVAWLAANDLADIGLVVNVDGAGLAGCRIGVAPLAWPVDREAALGELVERHPGLVLAEPWYESDHAVFAMRGIPCLALTSDAPPELLKRLSHDPDDSVERVDPESLARVIAFLRDAVETFTGMTRLRTR